MKEQFVFTSESVTAGHPDRLCDTVCDAVLDRYLQQDPCARLVAECALSKNVLFLAARFAAEASVDIPEVARQVITEVGYREEDFDPDECTVVTSFNQLPADRRWPVDETGLSDAELERLPNTHQVTVFGFACNQTPEFLPLPIVLANRLVRRLTAARREGLLPGVSPDCTVQVGVAFQGQAPVRIHSLTLIAGHESGGVGATLDVRGSLIAHVVDAVFQDQAIRPDQDTQIILNP
ncbi:MAG: methionine adenosyltransferase, partial [Methylococcaceae bacterium]